MTNRATLEALLSRVVAGTGPDRELNADIAVTLGGWERKWHDSERPHGWYWRRGDYSWTAEGEGYPSNYLASLDTALTLLTDGWFAEIGTRPDYPWVRLFKAAPLRVTDIISGPTPPRAVIAAWIKVRMEAME